MLDHVPAVAARLVPDAVTGAAPAVVGYYARAAIRARFALERGAWSEAASLPVVPSPAPYADAITHFARALGAVRSGNAPAALPDIRRLTTLRDVLWKAGDSYWSGQVGIQRQAAEAWIAFATNRREDGIAMLRAAADAEGASDKAAVTPGPLAPARDLLAEMLLEAGRANEALAEFTSTLRREPNRYRAIAGAARAARAAGDLTAAAKFDRQLLELCRRADTERPELVAARRKQPAASRAERQAARTHADLRVGRVQYVARCTISIHTMARSGVRVRSRPRAPDQSCLRGRKTVSLPRVVS